MYKQAPFVRLLWPFMIGIVLQWYVQIPFVINVICCGFFAFILFLFSFLSISQTYQYKWVQGICINLIVVSIAVFFTQQKDIRNNNNWYGNFYNDSSFLKINIIEPPIEKEKSFKSTGNVIAIINNGVELKVTGKLLFYFAKNDTVAVPKYGNVILLQGGLQTIKNSGNPGAFNYGRYMVFQQTVHQVYVKPSDYVLLNQQITNPLFGFIFYCQHAVINTLQHYVQGDKKVTGIAEALLIGYKEDLDKDTVQAYSNTGVVHIIAISGMHLGLIYVVLVWLFNRLPIIKKSAIVKVILILSILWLFSLITGASASVLRSAVMFTCIVIGKNFFKQAVIYNSLATSAFLLLCYNPFLLWDVGFQLSYCALVGIVWLQKPIENLLYFKLKWQRKIWELCSITLAAQILTLPICIYYFHQIPTLFLFTNLLCVPLSTIILFAEILLIIFSAVPLLSSVFGKLVYVFTWAMNWVINKCNNLPFSLIDKVYATPFTTLFLYAFVCSMCAGILYKSKKYLQFATLFLLGFTICWGYGTALSSTQKAIVIYNVNKHAAIDFIAGNTYQFYGDDTLLIDGALQNFNLKPARILYQTNKTDDNLQNLLHKNNYWQYYNKRLVVINDNIGYQPLQTKIPIDVLLISHNPKIKLTQIFCAIKPTIVVFDGSNAFYKIAVWKQECDALNIKYHNTVEQGAYTLNIN